MSVVVHAVLGPPGHGVVLAALTQAGDAPVVRAAAVDALTPADLDRLRGADVVHVHVTDRLFGRTCEEAAGCFTAFARHCRQVSVTLHDVPMVEQGPALYQRRTAAYRSIVDAAAGVVVSSRHEAALLAAAGITPSLLAVVPLPIDRLPDPDPLPEVEATVGMLGWIYPGKGHEAALAAVPAGARFIALGSASPGHEDLAAQLRAAGAEVTGFIPEGALTGRLRRVGVPVAAHAQVSASASIGTWLAAGRRPVVLDGPWVRELGRRCPGALTVATPEGLPGAVRAALAEPAQTWLGETSVGPTSAAVSQQLQDFCRGLT